MTFLMRKTIIRRLKKFLLMKLLYQWSNNQKLDKYQKRLKQSKVNFFINLFKDLLIKTIFILFNGNSFNEFLLIRLTARYL